MSDPCDECVINYYIIGIASFNAARRYNSTPTTALIVFIIYVTICVGQNSREHREQNSVTNQKHFSLTSEL